MTYNLQFFCFLQLCIRGLVHVFKFLETQAIKDEKGSRAGGNYDGYATLRRAPRHNSSGNVLETTGTTSATTNRVPRHHVDSGYSTSDGFDKRWSHDVPSRFTFLKHVFLNVCSKAGRLVCSKKRYHLLAS